MKKILKYFTILSVLSLVTFSCDYDDTNYDMLFNNPDPNASYLAQFTNASQSFESGVSLAGDLIDIDATISVALMGLPQSEDITINFSVDPISTIDPSMYTLSGNSITIPAGQTAGSVTLTSVTENMPAGEPLKLVLNLDAGDKNSPNLNATVLKYELLRIAFCALENGSADLVGSYSVTEDNSGYENAISATADGIGLLIDGLGDNMIASFWGEPVVAGGTCTAVIAPNGLIEIPRQYIYTTIYDGANYDYEIEGTGKWTNCGDKPTMTITYDIYYPGDEEGLAKTYASYFKGPYLEGVFTMN